MKTKIIQNIKVIVLALVLALGVGYAYADFSLPLNLPPTCISGNPGCDAPLNVGSTQQDKLGTLRLNTGTPQSTNGLVVWGNSIFFGGAQFNFGTPVAGKVLTATDSNGNVSWQTPAAGGSSGVTSLTAGTGITLSPSPITTTGSISVDLNVLQKRVSVACAAGQAIKSIAADGTPTCVNVGSVTSLTAGTGGITLSPSTITTTGTISFTAVCGSGSVTQINNGVVTCMPAGGCMRNGKGYSSGATCGTGLSSCSSPGLYDLCNNGSWSGRLYSAPNVPCAPLCP